MIFEVGPLALKLDVEGAEAKVLRNMLLSGVLCRRVHNSRVEWHPHSIHTSRACTHMHTGTQAQAHMLMRKHIRAHHPLHIYRTYAKVHNLWVEWHSAALLGADNLKDIPPVAG